MNSLTSLDKRFFEDLFGMGSGYVLDYSDATYAEFFREHNIDINQKKYLFKGDSKAKRLRAFWEIESDDKIVGKVLEELLKVWRYNNPNPDQDRQKRYEEAIAITHRLQQKNISKASDANTFLKQQFDDINVCKLGLDESLLSIVKLRLQEAKKCMEADAPLSVIFLSGSVLEGILLSVASKNPKVFNQANAASKKSDGKVKALPEWSLAQLIDVAYETGFLKLDVKKFSHELRNFRNYIHPYEQARSRFQPQKRTAEICLQVLKAAISDLNHKGNS